jgi:hypothetical protein
MRPRTDHSEGSNEDQFENQIGIIELHFGEQSAKSPLIDLLT